MSRIDEIDEYGEGVREVLEKEPGIIFRIGNTVIFLVVVLLLLLAWFVHFPDVVPASVVITTENPPIKVVARENGYLNNLLLRDKDEVEKGDVIAVLDNTAHWDDVKQMISYVEQFQRAKTPREFANMPVPPPLIVGEIQDIYALFSQQISDYRYHLNQTTAARKIQSLEEQIIQVGKLNSILNREEETLKKQTAIAEKDFERNVKLHSEKVISDTDFENKELHLLEYRRKLENIHTQIVSNNIEIEKLRTSILDISRDYADDTKQKELAIQETSDRLMSTIETWKKEKLIQAPISGKISMARVWSSQQFIRINEEIFTIVPYGASGKIIGKATLSNIGAGKVKAGMTVNIRLKEYPAEEFGVLRATVKSISLVPDKEEYSIELEVPTELKTTYKKIIPFSPGMQGQAAIITEQYSLLQRLFFRLMDVSKNK